jgi:replicative DNA helicase
MAEARVDRDTRLNIRVHQTVYDRMHALAESMGIAAATLGAVAVSEYLAKHEAQSKQQEVIARTMVDMMQPMFEKLLQEEPVVESEEFVTALIGSRKRK